MQLSEPEVNWYFSNKKSTFSGYKNSTLTIYLQVTDLRNVAEMVSGPWGKKEWPQKKKILLYKLHI